MRSLVSALGAVFLGVMLLVGGQGLLNLLVVLRLEHADTPRLLVGAFMATYFAGQALGAVSVARLVARVGHVRAFAGCLALASAVALGHGMDPHPAVLGLLRLINGMCFVGALAVAEGWLNDRPPQGARGLVLALYTTAFYLAMGGSQLLAGLGDPASDRPFMIAGSLLALGVLPMAFSPAVAPPPPDASFLSPTFLFRRAPLAVTGALASGALFSLAITLGPGYLRGHGLEAAAVGRGMAAGLILGLLLMWPIGWLSDRLDRRRVMQGMAMVMAACSLLSMAAPAAGAAAVGASIVLLTAWMIPLYPMSLAHAGDRLPASKLVAGSATLLLLSAVGAAASPLIGALTMDALGPWGLHLVAGLVAAALAAFIAAQRWAVDPVDDQGAFQALPRSTPATAQLDPRGDDSPSAEPELRGPAGHEGSPTKGG